MTAHKHAENMLQYAQDAMETNTPWELWEWRRVNSTGPWDELEANPTWCEYNEYRRKPRTININGHEVPEPVQEAPPLNRRYYFACTASLGYAGTGIWNYDRYGMELLRRGLIHPTKEAAIAHTKALLSFTMREERDE